MFFFYTKSSWCWSFSLRLILLTVLSVEGDGVCLVPATCQRRQLQLLMDELSPSSGVCSC